MTIPKRLVPPLEAAIATFDAEEAIGFKKNTTPCAFILRCAHFSLMVFSSDAKKKKVMAYAGVPKDAADKGLAAPVWIKESLSVCGGKGGGKPNRAQGQGPGIDKLEEAMAKALELAEKTLG